VSSTEVIQRVAVSALQVEIPTASVTASTLDPSVGECLLADLDMGVGEDARRLDPKVARNLPEALADVWEVRRVWGRTP
jgi:hypothetical protein